jgi:hypothetical protein
MTIGLHVLQMVTLVKTPRYFGRTLVMLLVKTT